MKWVLLIFCLAVSAGLLAACATCKVSDAQGVNGTGAGDKNRTAGQDRNASGADYGNIPGQGGNQGTQDRILNQTRDEDKNQTKEQERNQTAAQNGSGSGISEEVRRIIEERKNGTISVPQGAVVRLIAHNRTMTVDEALIEVNESIGANVTVNGRNRTLRISPDGAGLNITEGNVTVETNETLEIENGTLKVAGTKVLLMPSEVPQKIGAKTIKSAVLHVANGDLVYQVNATKSAKVLWVFDADMDVEDTLDAATGSVISENRPWWSFLVTEQ